MDSSKTMDFGKAFLDMLSGVSEQVKLINECKMRRFYAYDEPVIADNQIVASGVVFEDGSVAVRYREPLRPGTAIYASVDDFQENNPLLIVKFIDAAQA